MQHDRKQSESPRIANGRRNRNGKRNQNQEQEGNSTIGGKLCPVVMGVIDVERKIPYRVALVDLWKRAKAITSKRSLFRHVNRGEREFLAHQILVVQLEFIPN